MTDALLSEAVQAARAWPQVTGKPVPHMIRENAIFRIDTDRGPHALRLHRPGYHSDAALTSELAWMGMLASQGLAVPAPLPTGTGDLLHPGPRRASLLSWEKGIPMGSAGHPLPVEGTAQRHALFRKIGQTIARVHHVSDQWTPPEGFTRPAWDCDGLTGEHPFWGRFWETPTLSADQRRRFSAFRDTARAALQRAKADIGMIHADLVRENVLVRDDDVCLIDFDDCGTGYRGFDLATCLRANLAEPDYPDLRDALFDGYAAIRPLPDPGLMPVIMALRALTYVSWASDRQDEPGMAARIPGYIAIAERLMG